MIRHPSFETPSKFFFAFSFILSCIVHLSFFIFTMTQSPKSESKKPLKSLEVTYQKSIQVKKEEKKPEPPKNQLSTVKKVELPKQLKSISRGETQKLTFDKKLYDLNKIPKKMSIDKQIPAELKSIDMKRDITVSMFKSDKMMNPSYLKLRSSVRDMIHRRVMSFKDHPDLESGEVYLTFVVSSDGVLHGVKIKESRTRASTFLRELSMRCIREVAPFPPFPPELNFPELTFNVLITYSVDHQQYGAK